MSGTPFGTQCAILADIWVNYRNDTEFVDFIEYNDLGLPLAYALDAGIVKKTHKAKGFIEESWALLLAGLDIEEDTGFESLEDLLQIESV